MRIIWQGMALCPEYVVLRFGRKKFLQDVAGHAVPAQNQQFHLMNPPSLSSSAISGFVIKRSLDWYFSKVAFGYVR